MVAKGVMQSEKCLLQITSVRHVMNTASLEGNSSLDRADMCFAEDGAGRLLVAQL